jgi:hypothetical protein
MNIEDKQKLLAKYKANLIKLEDRIASDGGYRYTTIAIQNQYDDTKEKIDQLETEIELLQKKMLMSTVVRKDDRPISTSNDRIYEDNRRSRIIYVISFFVALLVIVSIVVYIYPSLENTPISTSDRPSTPVFTQSSLEASTIYITQVSATATLVVVNEKRGTVIASGNLRSDPSTSNQDNVLGLILTGDQFVFLEEKQTQSGIWYRIKIIKESPNRELPGVASGTEGWASATLLSPQEN